MQVSAFLLLCLATAAISEVLVTRISSDKLKDVRLPMNVLPERYRLQLLPILEEGNFTTQGEMELDLLVKSKTDQIVLHSVNLEIDESSVSLSLSKIIPKRDVIFVKKRDRFIPKGRSTPRKIEEERYKDEPELTKLIYDSAKETATFVFDSPLKMGERYTLRLAFTGSLPADLKGFYRSSFLDRNGNKRWLAVTQFEATDARRAFPCFDEPAMKATFDITLGRKESMSALTNMPKIRTEPMLDRPGWVWDVFERSVPMSTYLVAFFVSDFEFKEAETYTRETAVIESQEEMRSADEVDSTDPPTTDLPLSEEPPAPQPGPVIRIWARSDAMNQTELAATSTPAMLSFLEKYFGIEYPLPKLDLVGLPDFAAGAMENWGLITYRERALLYDPSSSVARDRLYVQKVVAHELAHQWFGNLVTMKWWTDLWLNEGFATYVQGLAINHVEPNWKYLDYFTLEIQDVLGLDSLESSHPISAEVVHPDQITELFDAISYKKGAAIIRMMNFFLGESSFRGGVTNYLKDKKYGNAEQDDLWKALTDQAHADGTLPDDIDVKSIMDSWTLKKGYPVVTVTRNYKDGSASLSQKRFLLNPDSKSIEFKISAPVTEAPKSRKKNRFAEARKISQSPPPQSNKFELRTTEVRSNDEETHYSWWVPITATGGSTADFNATNTVLWLNPEEDAATLKHKVEASQWLILNIQRSGFYRVNYDDKNWQMLINQLRSDHKRIHPVNRAQLIDDSFSLAASGQLPYTLPLELSRYLVNERDTVPIASAVKEWGKLSGRFKHTADYGLFKKAYAKLFLPASKSFGLDRKEEETGLEGVARVTVSNIMCSLDLPTCTGPAIQLFKKWMTTDDPDSENPIKADISGSLYCAALRHGGEEEWEFLKDRLAKVNTATQRDVMLSSLGCTYHPWLLRRYINAAFVENPLRSKWGIRKQDWRAIAGSVASNPVGRNILVTFAKERWDDVHKFFGSTLTPLRLFQTAVSSFSTEAEVTEGLFIFCTVDFAPSSYADVVFPGYVNAIGWVISAVPISLIPIVAIMKISKAKGSLRQRIDSLIKPTPDWGPALHRHRAEADVPRHVDSRVPLTLTVASSMNEEGGDLSDLDPVLEIPEEDGDIGLQMKPTRRV